MQKNLYMFVYIGFTHNLQTKCPELVNGHTYDGQSNVTLVDTQNKILNSKTDELVIHATTWMNFKCIMISENTRREWLPNVQFQFYDILKM